MRLWVIRHADAVRSSVMEDDERPLSDHGREQAGRLARYLCRRATPDLLWSSPLLRARQTAEPIRAEFPSIPFHLVGALALGNGAQQVIDDLRNTAAGECILIGHEPLTSHLVSRLVSGNDALHLRFAPGTVALVEIPDPVRIGAALLLEYASPELLATLT